jgi:hypothetical protein
VDGKGNAETGRIRDGDDEGRDETREEAGKDGRGIKDSVLLFGAERGVMVVT